MSEAVADLDALLACPRCRGALARAAKTYACRGDCRTIWPVVAGIPRFVDSEHYVGSFGWEWRRHRSTQIDSARSRESEETFAAKTGLQPADVKGKIVLDVGVGSARFSHVVGRWGGIPVGIDLSLAVLTARRNLAPFYPNALVLQADAFRLPFREEAFDHVFSIGVLHHTPSTREAFRHVARFVKPGGTVALAVYDAVGEDAFEYSQRYRRWTTALPHSLLHAICHVAIPENALLDAIESWAGDDMRSRFKKILPTSDHPNPLWSVLDTFDWYSPRFQWLHDEDEVKRWFRDLGFEDVRRLSERTMVSVRGTRPRAGPLATPPPSEERRLGATAPLPAWLPDVEPFKSTILVAALGAELARASAREGVRSIGKAILTAAVVAAKKALGIQGDLLAQSSPHRSS